MDEISKRVGERIRSIRKERGYSQEELAHLASMHPTYIGQLERAEKNVTLESLAKLSSALGTTLEELFRQLQPHSKEPDSYMLSEIVTLLQSRSSSDLKYVQNHLKQMFDWKDSRKV